MQCLLECRQNPSCTSNFVQRFLSAAGFSLELALAAHLAHRLASAQVLSSTDVSLSEPWIRRDSSGRVGAELEKPSTYPRVAMGPRPKEFGWRFRRGSRETTDARCEFPGLFGAFARPAGASGVSFGVTADRQNTGCRAGYVWQFTIRRAGRNFAQELSSGCRILRCDSAVRFRSPWWPACWCSRSSTPPHHP